MAAWKRILSGATWGARQLHTAELFGGRQLVIGGGVMGVAQGDVWGSQDGVHWDRDAPAAGWTARYEHASCVFDAHVWVFGGVTQGGVTRLNDVWRSGNGTIWERVSASCAWSARSRFRVVPHNGRMFLIAGYNGTTALDDIWSSVDGRTWRQIRTGVVVGSPVTGTQARRGHCALAFNGRLWVFGGYTGTAYLNDVWSSGNGEVWSRQNAAASWAGRTYASCCVWNERMWIIGGMGAAGPLNDVWWSQDGVTWTRATASEWTARYGAAAVAFEEPHRIRLFGGALAEVWESDNLR